MSERLTQNDESNQARGWIYKRFGVDETPYPTRGFDERLDEFGDDPRVMATDAEMRAQGIIMGEGTVYDVMRRPKK